MKRLIAILLAPLAAMLLLSSCLHKSGATKFYALEPVAQSGNDTISITLTGLYQTQEMRYLTPEGEVLSIPGCRWAMPLQKLIDAAIGKERNEHPRIKANCRLNSILWKSNEGFTLSGEIFLILNRPMKDQKRFPYAIDSEVKKPQPFQISLPCPKKPTGATLRGVIVQGLKQILAQAQELIEQGRAQLAAEAQAAQAEAKAAPAPEPQPAPTPVAE